MKQKINIAVLVSLTLTLGACTKARDYKTVYKDEVIDAGVKSALTGGDKVSSEFVYVASQLESPHSTDATFPGWQGQENIIKFRFTEKELLAETVVEDGRFASNTANAKPVLSIPVTHVDYRCADNGAGECSNKEEEVNDVAWQQKKSFKPDVAGMKVEAATTLPIEIDKVYGSECHTEVGSRVISANFTPDAVNIEVEKTYRANIDCLQTLDSLSDLTFNVRHMHSFIRRSQLISPNYVAVNYPKTDENTFGFFTTESHRLSTDNRDEEKGEKTIMNRWNPTRKTLPYFLTANFDKPELKKVKEATIEAVGAINNALKEANVDLMIDLKGTTDASYGDIRNSMVVLVEDPQESGVIGYGPTVADPRTGEILAARVVMYYGTMKKFVRSTWDEYVDESRAKEAATADSVPGAAKTLSNAVSAQLSKLSVEKQKSQKYVSSMIPKLKLDSSLNSSDSTSVSASRASSSSRTGLVKIDDRAVEKMKKELLALREKNVHGSNLFADEDDQVAAREAKLSAITKYNVYPAELINFEGSIKLATLDELKDMPKKYWADLSDEEQEKIIEVTLPYVWIPTLVHELGHNLGLRHNFAGSEDKKNFYSPEEVAGYGHSHPMEYSSIMDYGYHELNNLRVMGKYDIAALRYGYRREVMKGNGEIIPLSNDLVQTEAQLSGLQNVALAELEAKKPDMTEVQYNEEKEKIEKEFTIKDFKFCTDENVGINAGCRRFDEGTSYAEIAAHLGRAYNETFKRLNNRMGRRNFSDTADGTYAQRIANTFFDMRPFFETYEMLQKRFNLPEGHPAWESNEFLKDVKKSALIARESMIAPMLVAPKTCVIQNQEGQVEVAPMQALGGFYSSCFDPAAQSVLKEAGYVAIGEFGKSFQNQKYETSTNPYVDQIDLRGIWADKLLAPVFLTTRRLGVSTFDKYTGNFLDTMGGTAERVVDIMNQFLMNEVTTDVEVAFEDGGSTTVKDYKYSPMSTHMVPALRSRGLRRALHLPGSGPGESGEEVPYAQILLQNVLLEMRDNLPSALARQMRDFYGITPYLRDGENPADYASIVVDGARYFIHKKKNVFSMGVLNQLSIVKTLEAVKKDRLEIVLAAAKKAEAPPAVVTADDTTPTLVAVVADPVLTETEKAAIALGSNAIEAYMKGAFQPSSYLELVITMLGRVNSVVTY